MVGWRAPSCVRWMSWVMTVPAPIAAVSSEFLNHALAQGGDDVVFGRGCGEGRARPKVVSTEATAAGAPCGMGSRCECFAPMSILGPCVFRAAPAMVQRILDERARPARRERDTT